MENVSTGKDRNLTAGLKIIQTTCAGGLEETGVALEWCRPSLLPLSTVCTLLHMEGMEAEAVRIHNPELQLLENIGRPDAVTTLLIDSGSPSFCDRMRMRAVEEERDSTNHQHTGQRNHEQS